MSGEVEAIDRATRHLWHTSQHGSISIWAAGRIQEQVDDLRESAGLDTFGWNTSFPDSEFGECSVHTDGCAGQETHAAARPADPDRGEEGRA